MAKVKYIIGIDEVGRGPLAGPVTVAAVALLRVSGIKYLVSGIKLRDSKKLKPRQREIWFEYIKNHPKIFYAQASVSPAVIDRINISQAANLAATRVLNRLITNYQLPITKIEVLLDGGLYINNFKLDNFKLATVIKGDEKIPAIMLASIVAKVSRDKKMKKLHKKYPQYGFDEHKGYGTKKHVKAIKKCGQSPIHRKSFKLKIKK